MSGEMTAARLAEIRAREQAATEGPWFFKKRKQFYGMGQHHQKIAEIRSETACYVSEIAKGIKKLILEHVSWYVYPSDADLEFVAHSRVDVPDLMAALAAETARADRAEAATNQVNRAYRALKSRPILTTPHTGGAGDV